MAAQGKTTASQIAKDAEAAKAGSDAEQPTGQAVDTPADTPNADTVPPLGDSDDLVRIDPAQNMRPAVVARGGRQVGGQLPEMSKQELADFNQEVQDLRGRLAKLEALLGPASARRTFVMSEGVRQDVELHGYATDPLTGETFTREDLGRISER